VTTRLTPTSLPPHSSCSSSLYHQRLAHSNTTKGPQQCRNADEGAQTTVYRRLGPWYVFILCFSFRISKLSNAYLDFIYSNGTCKKLQNTGQGERWEVAATRKLGEFFFFPFVYFDTN
jgi:hypothetical protein